MLRKRLLPIPKRSYEKGTQLEYPHLLFFFFFPPLANTSFKLRLLPESKEGKCHHSLLPSNQNIRPPPRQFIPHVLLFVGAVSQNSGPPDKRRRRLSQPWGIQQLYSSRSIRLQAKCPCFPSQGRGRTSHFRNQLLFFFFLYGNTPAPSTLAMQPNCTLTMDTATKLVCRTTQTRKRRPIRKESTKTCHNA